MPHSSVALYNVIQYDQPEVFNVDVKLLRAHATGNRKRRAALQHGNDPAQPHGASGHWHPPKPPTLENALAGRRPPPPPPARDTNNFGSNSHSSTNSRTSTSRSSTRRFSAMDHGLALNPAMDASVAKEPGTAVDPAAVDPGMDPGVMLEPVVLEHILDPSVPHTHPTISNRFDNKLNLWTPNENSVNGKGAASFAIRPEMAGKLPHSIHTDMKNSHRRFDAIHPSAGTAREALHGPNSADPFHPDPLRMEPLHRAGPINTADALQRGPINNDPLHADPLHTDPLLADPLHADPLHADPLHADPLHGNPLHADPLHAEPLLADPLHSNALHTDPLHANEQLHNTGFDMHHNVGGINPLNAASGLQGLHRPRGMNAHRAVGPNDNVHATNPADMHAPVNAGELHNGHSQSTGNQAPNGDALSSITINSLDGSSFMTGLRNPGSHPGSQGNSPVDHQSMTNQPGSPQSSHGQIIHGQSSLGPNNHGPSEMNPNNGHSSNFHPAPEYGPASTSSLDMPGPHGSHSNGQNQFDPMQMDAALYDVTTTSVLDYLDVTTTTVYETNNPNNVPHDRGSGGHNKNPHVDQIVPLEQLTLDQGMGQGHNQVHNSQGQGHNNQAQAQGQGHSSQSFNQGHSNQGQNPGHGSQTQFQNQGHGGEGQSHNQGHSFQGQEQSQNLAGKSWSQGTFANEHGIHGNPHEQAQTADTTTFSSGHFSGHGASATGSHSISSAHESASVHKTIPEVTTSPRRLPVGVDVPKPGGAGKQNTPPSSTNQKGEPVFETQFMSMFDTWFKERFGPAPVDIPPAPTTTTPMPTTTTTTAPRRLVIMSKDFRNSLGNSQSGSNRLRVRPLPQQPQIIPPSSQQQVPQTLQDFRDSILNSPTAGTRFGLPVLFGASVGPPPPPRTSGNGNMQTGNGNRPTGSGSLPQPSPTQASITARDVAANQSRLDLGPRDMGRVSGSPPAMKAEPNSMDKRQLYREFINMFKQQFSNTGVPNPTADVVPHIHVHLQPDGQPIDGQASGQNQQQGSSASSAPATAPAPNPISSNAPVSRTPARPAIPTRPTQRSNPAHNTPTRQTRPPSRDPAHSSTRPPTRTRSHANNVRSNMINRRGQMNNGRSNNGQRNANARRNPPTRRGNTNNGRGNRNNGRRNNRRRGNRNGGRAGMNGVGNQVTPSPIINTTNVTIPMTRTKPAKKKSPPPTEPPVTTPPAPPVTTAKPVIDPDLLADINEARSYQGLAPLKSHQVDLQGNILPQFQRRQNSPTMLQQATGFNFDMASAPHSHAPGVGTGNVRQRHRQAHMEVGRAMTPELHRAIHSILRNSQARKAMFGNMRPNLQPPFNKRMIDPDLMADIMEAGGRMPMFK